MHPNLKIKQKLRSRADARNASAYTPQNHPREAVATVFLSAGCGKESGIAYI